MGRDLRRVIEPGENLGRTQVGWHGAVTTLLMDTWLHPWTLDPDSSLETGGQRLALSLPLAGIVKSLCPLCLTHSRPLGPMVIIYGAEFRSLPIAKGLEEGGHSGLVREAHHFQLRLIQWKSSQTGERGPHVQRPKNMLVTVHSLHNEVCSPRTDDGIMHG